MSDFFNWDNKFMTAMSKASDAILLGILWIACCLPIVTVGASSAAFYYAYHKAVRQRRGYAWKEFFSAFKSNFKSAIIIWLIILGLYLVTGMDCYILYTSLETMDHALFLLLMIMIVIALITIWGIYVFPYLARFENTTKVIIKNSIAVKLLGAVLNASVTELTAEQLSPELLSRVTRSAGNAASLVPVIMDFVTSLLHQEHSEVYMTGQAKLLGQPEYHDIDKAQKMLSALDEDVVSNLPAALSPDSRTQILVGPENVSKELRDTSVVMTKFDIGDGMQGLIGVVGPTRMDYAQITARLSYFAENLSRMFQKNQTPAIEGPENKHNDPEA